MSYVKISSADNDIHDANSNVVAIKTWTKRRNFGFCKYHLSWNDRSLY